MEKGNGNRRPLSTAQNQNQKSASHVDAAAQAHQNLKTTQLASNPTVAATDSENVKPSATIVDQISTDCKNLSISQKKFLHPAPVPKATLNVVETGGDPVKDIDLADLDKPAACSEYAGAMVNYMFQREANSVPPVDFLSGCLINPKMRFILHDWLVKIHENFKLAHDTLFLTVQYCDMFLSRASVPRGRYQLLGMTAMALASKVEDVRTFPFDEYLDMSENSFTRDEMIDMECRLIEALEFDLTKPHSLHFLRRFSKARAVKPTNHNMAKFFLDLSLCDHELASVLPSERAAAALYLTLHITSNVKWGAHMEHHTTYKKEQLWDTAARMLKNGKICAVDETSFKGVLKKYTSTVFGRLAKTDALQTACKDLTKFGGFFYKP